MPGSTGAPGLFRTEFPSALYLQIFCCLWDPNVRGWAGAGVQVGASIPHPIPLCPPCVLLYRPLLSQLPRRRKGSGCKLWESWPLTDSGLQDPITTRGPQHPSARCQQHRENPATFRVWTPPTEAKNREEQALIPKGSTETGRPPEGGQGPAARSPLCP